MGYSLTVNITQLVLTSRTVVSRIPFALRWNVAAVCSALSLIGLLLCHLYTTPDNLEMGPWPSYPREHIQLTTVTVCQLARLAEPSCT